MKYYFLLLFITISVFSFAHKGHTISFENVEVEQGAKRWIVSFEVVNEQSYKIKNIRVELTVNGQLAVYRNIDLLDINEKVSSYVSVPANLLKSAVNKMELRITSMNGINGSWAVKDVPLPAPKQYDDVGSYELFADGPWRMDIYDSSNNRNDIPVYLHLHDGDGISYPWIQYVDISIKRSTDANFGSPITFGGYTQAQFDALFSSKSINDGSLDSKDFDDSQAEPDNNHTIAFKENYYNPWFGSSYYYTSVQNFLWFATINLPPSVLVGFADTDHLDIKVEFTIRQTLFSNPETYLRVFRHDTSIPSLPNWYRGDTHLHSIYTQNTAEQGLALEATKQVGKLVGLDWIVATDHTSDFDNFGNGNVNTNWAKLGVEIGALNAADPSMIYIRGQEVSLQNSVGELVHMLGYPNYLSPIASSFLGDGDGDATPTNVTVSSALSTVDAEGGFAYSAHPFATNDELNPLINGGIWNLGDASFPTNGNNFPITGGNIICNDPGEDSDVLIANGTSTTKLVKDGLVGGQIWNDRISMSTSDDPQDPYNCSGGNTPFSPIANNLEYHYNRFSQGLEIVNFINQKGLLLKNAYPAIENWKFFLSAGSDAHGSFNFSTTGYIQSFVGSLGGEVSNGGVGKLSTIAYGQGGMGTNGTNILKSLHEGNISLSDGPIVVQGLSIDGNNASNELLMGGDAVINETDTPQAFLNLQFSSTSEFGTISSVELILGTSSGETSVNVPVAGNTLSLSISQVNGLLSNAIPMDEYFYLRQVISTTKNYGAGTPQIIQTETFHSLTNPIWMKINPSTSLPVELIEFTAIKVEDYALLNWITYTEINNEGFEVERSFDGMDWHTITWVEGSGSTNEIQEYSHKDLEPNDGANYYRLKQLDYNGEFEYSDVRYLYFNQTSTLQLYPNPNLGQIWLKGVESGTSIQIFNMIGALELSSTYNSVPVDVSHLSSGTYMLHVTTGDKVEVLPFVKQNR